MLFGSNPIQSQVYLQILGGVVTMQLFRKDLKSSFSYDGFIERVEGCWC